MPTLQPRTHKSATTQAPPRVRSETSVGNGTQITESKRGKFERLAVARVKKILKSIDILKNIGRNRSSYDFTNEDVAKIITALRRKVDELEGAMLNTKTEEQTFEL